MNRRSDVTYVVTLIVTLLVVILWLSWIAPYLKKIPDHFNYSADILSLDNFYDEKTQKFEGEHISKTLFSYNVEAVKPGYDIVNNTFSVSKLSDKPIFSVSRRYFINPYTGAHVAVPGEKVRNGYLFAPRSASMQPFYYWHINYDEPATMRFKDAEWINGLMVYHYAAHYSSDQTANLTNLPGVPDKRGIKTDIKLQLWIEPVTGWLVKYQDNTLAYYYDRATGQFLSPWNQFSNRYTQNSINEKVRQAKRLKWKYLLCDVVAPLVIILLPMSLLYWRELQRRQSVMLTRMTSFFVTNRTTFAVSGLLCLFAVASVVSLYYLIFYDTKTMPYTIGVSTWSDNSELLSAVQGFKDGLASQGYVEGKDVIYVVKNPSSSVEKQIDIIQSFVRDKVDLIYTLTTPGTLVAKGVTNSIPIVFTDVSYPVESGIVNPARAENTNLTGMINFISPAVQFFQLDVVYPHTRSLGFVHHKGDPDSEIQYQQYKSMLQRRGIEVIEIPAIDFDDLQIQLQQALQTQHINALFVACDTLIRDGGGKIAADFAMTHKIPSLSCDRESVIQGVLLGYFADLHALGERAGAKAALILRGAKPGWLHPEALSTGELIVNDKTARWLSLTIPADEMQAAKHIDS